MSIHTYSQPQEVDSLRADLLPRGMWAQSTPGGGRRSNKDTTVCSAGRSWLWEWKLICSSCHLLFFLGVCTCA